MATRTVQLKVTTPLTSILSPAGRGSKPPRENESPFSERDRRGADSDISSPLAGEGRVRGASDCMDTAETPARPDGLMRNGLRLRARGHNLSMADDACGWLADSSELRGDVSALRERLREDGYLFLRGFHPRAEVLQARQVVTDRLSRDGFLDPAHPPLEAVAAPRLKVVNEKSAFRPPTDGGGASDPVKTYNADTLTKQNQPLHDLLYGRRQMAFFEQFLDGPVRHYNYTWLRVVSPGLGTPPHCDTAYMGRGTQKVLTTWTALGDISLRLGGLMILEHSHKANQLASYLKRDVDDYCVNGPHAEEITSGKRLFEWDGTLSKNPVSLRNKLGGRWLTAEYQAGDILIFTIRTVHASLDNQSNQIRLSSDSRYQLASEPMDERYNVENPVPYSPQFKRGRVC